MIWCRQPFCVKTLCKLFYFKTSGPVVYRSLIASNPLFLIILKVQKILSSGGFIGVYKNRLPYCLFI